jgi:carboxypeptidase PM20D1
VAGLLFKTITPDLPWKQKILFANTWLFKPLILHQLKKDTFTNAMIRTTLAPTIINGGVKENILPTKAHALVNFRLLPGDSIADVTSYAKKIVNDPNIEIVSHGNIGIEASPVSDTNAMGYRAIKQAVQQVFPGTAVAPGLDMGGTDSKHYLGVTENSYRFSPIVFGESDMERIHGTDERIGIKDYIRMVQFYGQVIKNSN